MSVSEIGRGSRLVLALGLLINIWFYYKKRIQKNVDVKWREEYKLVTLYTNNNQRLDGMYIDANEILMNKCISMHMIRYMEQSIYQTQAGIDVFFLRKYMKIMEVIIVLIFYLNFWKKS